MYLPVLLVNLCICLSFLSACVSACLLVSLYLPVIIVSLSLPEESIRFFALTWAGWTEEVRVLLGPGEGRDGI